MDPAKDRRDPVIVSLLGVALFDEVADGEDHRRFPGIRWIFPDPARILQSATTVGS
jgi:hypothetical protein